MPIFKLADGRFFEANEEDLNFLTETDLIRKLEHAKRKVNEFEALLQAQKDNPDEHVPVEPETPVTPVDNPPAQPEQPVVSQFTVEPQNAVPNNGTTEFVTPEVVEQSRQPEQVTDVPNDPIRIQ